MEANNLASPCSYSCHVLLTIVLTYLLFISNMQTTIATTTTTTIKTSSNTYQNYIKTACNSTTFPTECYNSLVSYASEIKTNPEKLCNTALSISLNASRNASALVSTLAKQEGLTPTETAIIKDCIENIGDSIDELQQSLQEIGQLGGSDVEFQMSNIKTWVSAAITDEDTCTDGFDGRKVNATLKNEITKSIVNLARLTSNALALINNLNY